MVIDVKGSRSSLTASLQEFKCPLEHEGQRGNDPRALW